MTDQTTSTEEWKSFQIVVANPNTEMKVNDSLRVDHTGDVEIKTMGNRSSEALATIIFGIISLKNIINVKYQCKVMEKPELSHKTPFL